MSEADNDNLHHPAARHLGKNASASTHYDAGLLVAVPRAENRNEIGYSEAPDTPLHGRDIWHAYEVSCLLDSGLPVVGMLRIAYEASTVSIVESKSLKLYLNSFHGERMGISRERALENLRQRVEADLGKLLAAEVKVEFVRARTFSETLFNKQAQCLEHLHPAAEVGDYEHKPELLGVQLLSEVNMLNVYSQLLRSNCRITSQPDWGQVSIFIEGTRLPSTDSLLAYLVSFRNECHFHEEIVEAIYFDLYQACQPQSLAVAARYTRRGGIDINPVRVNDPALLGELLPEGDVIPQAFNQ